MRYKAKTIKALTTLKNTVGTGLYRLLEKADGEKSNKAYIPYKTAQPLKVFILIHLLNEED